MNKKHEDNTVIVFPEDETAARFLSGIEGWVSRRGQYFGVVGDAEAMARWDGATHVRCKGCEVVAVEKRRGVLLCDICSEKRAIERWQSLPEKEWVAGEDAPPLYSERDDVFFFDYDDFEDYAEDCGITVDDLRLVICEPVFPPTVDPEDFIRDRLPDDGDGEIPSDILDAFDRLNEFLENYKTPLSWAPGKFRVKMEA